MEFCNNCNNMYYMKLNNMKQLIYVCKNCGNEDTQQIETNNLKVYKYIRDNGGWNNWKWKSSDSMNAMTIMRLEKSSKIILNH